ncbi:DUF2512 family protein [Bacillus toyonensis]|uniref:DUF2512 family protein n=1 Tax=Bacillus toyonensis TaxID=155322 RepID=UPI00352A90FA
MSHLNTHKPTHVYKGLLFVLLLSSLLITGKAYLIGGLFVLPKYGNMVATCADVGLSF